MIRERESKFLVGNSLNNLQLILNLIRLDKSSFLFFYSKFVPLILLVIVLHGHENIFFIIFKYLFPARLRPSSNYINYKQRNRIKINKYIGKKFYALKRYSYN